VHAICPKGLADTCEYKDVALGAQHTCPHIAQAKDKSWLLYTTGQAMDCPTTCTGSGKEGGSNATLQAGRPCAGTGFFGLNVASSKSLSGPWSSIDNLAISGYGEPVSKQNNVNPSPLVLQNGSVVVAYCDDSGSATNKGEQIALAYSDTPATGPYRKLGKPSVPIFEHNCEDPMIYKGRFGYHIICHDMSTGPTSKYDPTAMPCRFQGIAGCSGQVGLHAFASEINADGSGWATSPRLINSTAPSAYGANVTFTDGTTFAYFRRERPELRTNAKGDPTHLITGIEYFSEKTANGSNAQFSFTIVQEVDLSEDGDQTAALKSDDAAFDSAPPPPPAPVASFCEQPGWSTTFVDEFDGPLNTTTWNAVEESGEDYKKGQAGFRTNASNENNRW